MKIGEKIKTLRTAKMMTQSELAGDNITRNMLSRIENGFALPSLPTLMYISSRLKVPAGYLIADEDNEEIYRKINCIDDIKRTFSQKNYGLCLSMCKSESVPYDDEIALIMAECALFCAKDELFAGRLRNACSFMDEALDYCGDTIYNTEHIESRVSVIFRYLGSRVSRTLFSVHDISTGGENDMLAYGDDFCRFALALEYVDSEEEYWDFAENILRDSQYSDIIKAYRLTKCSDYVGAYNLLETLLGSDIQLGNLILYFAMCLLEECCRENGDFRHAYEFSSGKVRLLERMLSENEKL